MKKQGKRTLRTGILLAASFAVWTVLVRTVDVQCIGPMGTSVGFASFNAWFHRMTGVHMAIYTVTDWLGLVPVFVCLGFAAAGFAQLLARKSLLKLDVDIIVLGFYYLLVIFAYLAFEMLPVNYRPVLIDGRLEASYPSSTTLLVLSVMPTLAFQSRRRLKNTKARNAIAVFSYIFSVSVVMGRLISGVHWFTDILGSVLLSAGLFCVFQAVVVLYCRKV